MNGYDSLAVPSARPSPPNLARVLTYLVIGVFLLLFLFAARLGPDMLSYLQWSQAFRQLDTQPFLFNADTLSPLGVPLTQWSHGPGLIVALCPVICGQLDAADPRILWFGWGFALLFWGAMFRLLRQAGYGEIQWAVYGIVTATFGMHLGYYSSHFGSESLSQTSLAMLALWVLTRKRWRIPDVLVAGCLAAFLAIIRLQLLLYAAPLFGAMYYGLWKTRGKQRLWVTILLSAFALVPILLGFVQLGFANRWMTGDILRSPYTFGNAIFKSLDFTRPELAAVLLHPWHGLLSYHPLYLLGFIALLILAIRSKSRAERLFYISFVFIILAHVYLQGAWYAWWLGTQTFGMRGLSISGVVLLPAIVRYMSDRERRGLPNTRFGILVLVSCLWSLLLLLATLRDYTQFMTYTELLDTAAKWTQRMQLPVWVYGITLAVAFLALWAARNIHLQPVRDALAAQFRRRPMLSVSLLILFPIGVYGLAAYVLARHAKHLGLSPSLVHYLALATIPLAVLLILLFLSATSSAHSSVPMPDPAPIHRKSGVRVDRPGRLAGERLAAYLVIGVFMAANVVFFRLARHIENQIATRAAPAGQSAYVSAVRVDEVESSYCEYINVPGFGAKKAALGQFVEELRACTKVQPATLGLPQCTTPSTADHPLAIAFAPFLSVDRVSVAGGEATESRPVFRAGDRVGITTYWNVLQDTAPLKFSLRLQNSQGRQWTSVDYWPDVGCQSVDTWPSGAAHTDRQGISLPPDLPPGAYEIALSVYDPQTGIAVPVGEEPSAALTSLDVLAAATPPAPETLGIPERLDLRVSDQLALLGYGIQPEPLRPESESWLSVWWAALHRAAQPYQVRLELLDDAGEAVFSSIQPLSSAPADTWQSGQIVAERYPIALDPTVGSGDYLLRLTLLGSDGAAIGQPAELGTIAVVSRPHTYELPALEHSLNTALGGEIALRGYTIDRQALADKELRLTLYWQALERVARRYRVFVHVLDETGRIVSQMDEEPAGGATPTQTWLQGEVVEDIHVLSVPTGGPYQLLTGLYDAETGQRLPALDEAQQPIPDGAIPLERLSAP